MTEALSGLSEEELMDYLNNFSKYTPEAIVAAVDELKRRGKIFTDRELNEIKLRIQKSTEIEEEEDDPWYSSSWKKNVTTDENVPLLYSQGAISGFSVFFSVLFGAVLLSLNIPDARKKLIVVGFGIAYTAITILLANFTPIYWVIMANTAGGLGLITTFWDMYIGKKTKYRSKPIWKPLIFATIITVGVLLILLYR